MTDKQQNADEIIERATRALRGQSAEIDDVRRARLWAHVRSAPANKTAWWPSWRVAGPLVAAAAVIVLALVLRPETPIPSSSDATPRAPMIAVGPERVHEDITVNTGDGTLTIIAMSAVRRPALLPLQLLDGQATLRLPDRPPPLAAVVLDTPHTSIALLAGRARVDVDNERTAIEIEDGRVRLHANGVATIVEAGHSVTIGVDGRPIVIEPEVSIRPDIEREAVVRVGPKRRRATKVERPSTRDDDDVTRARRLVRRDAPQAERVAKAVLERRPSQRVEARALMVLADVERLAGHQRAAAELYRRVLDLRAGRDFFEEAILRRAEQLSAVGAYQDALDTLNEADKRGTGRALLPERRAQEIRLLLRTAGVLKAAQRLSESDAIEGVAMTRIRIEVAEALLPIDPASAKKIATDVIDRGGPAALLERARRIIDKK